MPKVYLTDRMIRGLSAAGGRSEAWDTVVPGLGLRYSSRKKTWFFVFHSPELRDARGQRRRRRMTLDDYPTLSLAGARSRAAELRAVVEQGIDPTLKRPAPAAGPVRFRDLGEQYLELESRPKKVRWDRDLSVLRSLYPLFGDRLASELTRGEIEAYLDEVAETRGAWAAHDHHKVLSRVLQWGVSKRGLPLNPVRGIPRLNPPARERILSSEEVAELWRVCEADGPTPGSRILRLRLVTAQRGTQLRQLHVSQLEHDTAGLWWNVPSAITKTSRPNRLFLGPLAEEILEEWPPTADGWFFGRPATERPRHGAGRKNQVRIRRQLDFPEWKGMDLRRTAATWMSRRGVSRFLLKRVLGHADGDMAAVYDLYRYDKEVKDAVLILEDAIREAIGRPRAGETSPRTQKPEAPADDGPSFLDLYP